MKISIHCWASVAVCFSSTVCFHSPFAKKKIKNHKPTPHLESFIKQFEISAPQQWTTLCLWQLHLAQIFLLSLQETQSDSPSGVWISRARTGISVWFRSCPVQQAQSHCFNWLLSPAGENVDKMFRCCIVVLFEMMRFCGIFSSWKKRTDICRFNKSEIAARCC